MSSASPPHGDEGSRGRGQFGRGRFGRGRFFRGRGRFRGAAGRGNHHHHHHHPDDDRSSSQTSVSLCPEPSPFGGWHIYFPEDQYKPGCEGESRVNVLKRYLQKIDFVHRVTSDGSPVIPVLIDVKEMANDVEDVQMDWPQFVEDLTESTEKTLACIGLAAYECMKELEMQLRQSRETKLSEVPIIQPRIINFKPVIPLTAVKASAVGKLVAVKGTVVRVGPIKPLCTWMAFECGSCNRWQSVRQREGRYMPPTRCTEFKCKCDLFYPRHFSSLTRTVNWQTMRLQELQDTCDVICGPPKPKDDPSGRVPLALECELTEDLVDSCIPGDVVTVVGIIKTCLSMESRCDGVERMVYMEAVSIVNEKNQPGSEETKSGSMRIGKQFTELDFEAIRALHSEENLLRLLVASLCPTICGNEIVKAGLILALFGGTAKDKDCIPVRGDIHVLLVGDPGVGKSQMLRACVTVAPRGVYICGNTTSAAGLTVTLTREGGDYALEGGALVLADQGCCCIDEFDKMSNHEALLEAMEQQTISVAKAGVVCTLPAHTAILAAANPAGGSYRKSQTVAENLKLGSALLSRFDLAYLLYDQPDVAADDKVTKHILSLLLAKDEDDANKSISSSYTSSVTSSHETPLLQRLQYRPDEKFDPVPPQLLCKYIEYARKYVKPNVTRAAAKVLQQFYLDLRSRYHSQDSTPITCRQLQSLIRLTEARAKVELRPEAGEQDARDIIQMMKASMMDTFSDDLGQLDFTRSQNGSGTSQRGQGKKFVAALKNISDKLQKRIFTVQEMKEVMQSLSIKVPDTHEFLSRLNLDGFLLKKGPSLYQLQISDY